MHFFERRRRTVDDAERNSGARRFGLFEPDKPRTIIIDTGDHGAGSPYESWTNR